MVYPNPTQEGRKILPDDFYVECVTDGGFATSPLKCFTKTITIEGVTFFPPNDCIDFDEFSPYPFNQPNNTIELIEPTNSTALGAWCPSVFNYDNNDETTREEWGYCSCTLEDWTPLTPKPTMGPYPTRPPAINYEEDPGFEWKMVAFSGMIIIACPCLYIYSVMKRKHKE